MNKIIRMVKTGFWGLAAGLLLGCTAFAAQTNFAAREVSFMIDTNGIMLSDPNVTNFQARLGIVNPQTLVTQFWCFQISTNLGSNIVWAAINYAGNLSNILCGLTNLTLNSSNWNWAWTNGTNIQGLTNRFWQAYTNTTNWGDHRTNGYLKPTTGDARYVKKSGDWMYGPLGILGMPDGNAALDVSGTNKGAIFPRMGQIARDGITNPTTGMIVFQTDNQPGYYVAISNRWQKLSTGDDKVGTIMSQTFAGTNLPVDWIHQGGFSCSNGLIPGGSGSTTNRIMWERDTAMEMCSFRVWVTIHDADAKIGLFRYPIIASKGMLAEWSVPDGLLRYWDYNWGAPAASKASGLAAVTGRQYLLELRKIDSCNFIFILTDTVTGHSTEYPIRDEGNTFGSGTGNPGIMYLGGSFTVNRAEFGSGSPRYVDAICVGNSNTEGVNVGALGDPDKRWAAMLRDSLEGKVVIAGRGGENSASLMPGALPWTRFLTDVESFRPKYVIYSIGSNDDDYNIWKFVVTTAIERIRWIGAQPILCTVPPRTDGGGGTEAIRRQMTEWVRTNGLPYIDVRAAVSTNDTDILSEYDYGDHVHFNRAGHQAIFDRIKVDCPWLLDSGREAENQLGRNGPIGVGTTNPEADAHVRTKDGAVLVERDIDAGGGPYMAFRHARESVPGNRTVLVANDELGALTFQGYAGTNFVTGAYMLATADSAVTNGGLPTRISYYVTRPGDALPSPALVIASGGVGVNMTPEYALHVNGVGSYAPGIVMDGGGLVDPFLYFRAGLSNAFIQTGTPMHIRTLDGTWDNRFLFGLAGDFWTASGITAGGWSNPGNRIHSFGDIGLHSYGDTLRWGTNRDAVLSKAADGTIAIGSSGVADALRFYTAGNTNAFVVDAEGRAGFGTTPSEGQVHVYSATTNPVVTIDGGGGADPTIYFRNPKDAGIIQSGKGLAIRLLNGGFWTDQYVMETNGWISLGGANFGSSVGGKIILYEITDGRTNYEFSIEGGTLAYRIPKSVNSGAITRHRFSANEHTLADVQYGDNETNYLVVYGGIKSTTNGYTFPDLTVQTTAYVPGAWVPLVGNSQITGNLGATELSVTNADARIVNNGSGGLSLQTASGSEWPVWQAYKAGYGFYDFLTTYSGDLRYLPIGGMATNSDRLDGYQPASAATASTVVLRDANGYIDAGAYKAGVVTTEVPIGAMIAKRSDADGYYYDYGAPAVRTFAFGTPTQGWAWVGTNDGAWALMPILSGTGGTNMVTLTNIPFSDGSSNAPSITFSNDMNTGFYLSGGDNIGVALNGQRAFNLSATEITARYGFSINSLGGGVNINDYGNVQLASVSGQVGVGCSPTTGWKMEIAGPLRVFGSGSFVKADDYRSSLGNSGITTNIIVLRPGPATNTLVFENGILTGVQ